MKNNFFISLVVFISLLTACSPPQQTVDVAYMKYEVSKNLQKDSFLNGLLTPYIDSVNETMNKVIGFATMSLQKKQPESSIGNFMTDAIREMAEKKFGMKVDIAFVNYGGIRSYIPKGNITIGKIYEVMPFDNIVVLQKLRGNILRELLDITASRGGWPCSGVKMSIKDKHAKNIMINGKPLQETTEYVVANSDYIANGGDKCNMLRGITQINKGYLLRDLLIEYVKMQTEQGKPVSAKIEGRVELL